MKLAIYGGMFSPPHLGHLYSLMAYKEAVRADKLYIMPSRISPHKAPVLGASAEERLDMCRLTFGEEAEISDYEINSETVSYTYLTVQHFLSEYDEVCLLVGTDMLMTIDQWKEPEYLLSHVTLYYAPREAASGEEKRLVWNKIKYLEEKYGTVTYVLKIKPYEISSKEIRKMIAEGGDWQKHVTPKTAEYIEKKRLYR